jgi:transposase
MPFNERSRAWTSQTSSGKYWSILFQIHLKEKLDEAGSGETPRDVLNGIHWILRTGAPWKYLPERYPPTRPATVAFRSESKKELLAAYLKL